MTSHVVSRVERILLIAGIASSLLYAAMNLLIPLTWPGYDSLSQTVSELSARGAPMRSLWGSLGVGYVLLVAAFGVGISLMGDDDRRLGVIGGVVIAYAVVCLLWPLAPMSTRGTPPVTSDRLHIALMIGEGALMIAMMGLSARALRGAFRWYTVASLAAMLGFGVLTALSAPDVAAARPTQWIGLWERMSIGAFLAWVIVFALKLLRQVAPANDGVTRPLDAGLAAFRPSR